MKTTNLRVLAEAAKGGAPGPMSSMLKIKGSLIRQAIGALAREALGPYALPYVAEALDEGSNVSGLGPEYANGIASEYFNHRKISIYGGSNEIQKGIITKAVLGL
jgi:alkylation response protein AidB-like acyl-CoA dehydrogenase